MIRKILGGILLYAVFTYCLITFGPQYDFYPIKLDPPENGSIAFFLILGGALWLVYDVVRYVLRLLTIPFNRLSFGILHILINVGVLYLLPIIVNSIDMGITVAMGTFIEVLILSIMLSLVSLLFKYL